MSMFGNGGPLDWEQLQRWLAGKGLEATEEMMREPQWVEKMVSQAMKQSLPRLHRADRSNVEQEDCYETHHFVFVRFKLDKGVRRDQLRLLVRADRIKLEREDGKKPIRVKLPCQVQPRSCRALLRAGVLQVKLRKRPVDPTYHEAFIRGQ
ncbi:hypothetical protein IDH44_18845 [Paenibacillus sp. IB182496]|uniref:Hsp20/alpha crystallin family protein n=1 Tax=Paenibacillus sabuli TaxID=2772509 RepID=A0A927GU16_9BACL|nr:Hsp20/alpha crystallin family protein [Paenibacillus sabuli]MBD2847262.1 hypothetical protein [Paenibacillus sabuli]